MKKTVLILTASFCIFSAQAMQKPQKSDLTEKQIKAEFAKKDNSPIPVLVNCAYCGRSQCAPCEQNRETFTLHCNNKNCRKTTIFWKSKDGQLRAKKLE